MMFCSFFADAMARLATRNSPSLVGDVGYVPRKWATDLHMDVENVEEDTGFESAFALLRDDAHDAAVGGRELN